MICCPQCHQNKKYSDYGRGTALRRHTICKECRRCNGSKECCVCGNEKRLTEFPTAGNKAQGYASYCRECASEYHRRRWQRAKTTTPPIRTDNLPTGAQLGELITWQYCAPAHLPPITLSGRVVGAVAGRLVAQVAGSVFVVGG